MDAANPMSQQKRVAICINVPQSPRAQTCSSELHDCQLDQAEGAQHPTTHMEQCGVWLEPMPPELHRARGTPSPTEYIWLTTDGIWHKTM